MKPMVHEYKKKNFNLVRKKLFLLLLLMAGTIGFGQNKLDFEYDAAGNQTMRMLCINCFSTRTASNSKTVKKEDMQVISDKLLYYPNPVIEELYISWELVNNKKVEQINLYSLAGVVLQTIDKPNADTVLTIPFGKYPTGIYIIVVTYNDGKSKSLKVEKK